MVNPVEGGGSAFKSGDQGASPNPDVGRKGGLGAHQRQPASSKTRHRVVVEWLVILVVALTAAVLIKTFAVQAFSIPTGSMEPTIVPGDRVLVNKLAYDLHAVHNGDVIVFRRPPRDISTDKDLIKRVMQAQDSGCPFRAARFMSTARRSLSPISRRVGRTPVPSTAPSGTLPGCSTCRTPTKSPPAPFS